MDTEEKLIDLMLAIKLKYIIVRYITVIYLTIKF